MPEARPEVSVVIRTFNEQRYLRGLLKALEDQFFRDFEVVVVDSGSFDKTLSIAQEYDARVFRIESRDFTFGYSLNVGARNSLGRYIAILSAHTLPVERTWLESLIGPLRDDGAAMVYGRQFGGQESKWGEMRDFLRTFGENPQRLAPPDFFANNANSAIRKDLWEEHPFDETLPGLEDIEWAKHWMERGYGVFYEPRAAIYHFHRETWRQVERRYYREAAAAKWIGIKSGADVPREILREGIHLMQDAAAALRAGSFAQKAKEIAGFRYYKLRGTVRGLRDGHILEGSAAREEFYFDKTCRAVVIHGPGRASLEEIEIPEVKPGDVLIKVAYVGVCATDLEVLDGTLGYYKNGMASYPIVPGHEFSGRVVKAGPNAKNARAGDAVVVECIQGCGTCPACRTGNPIACADRKEMGVIRRNGAYAEYVVVPSEFVHVLPPGADLRKACLCEPLAVVSKGLRRLMGMQEDFNGKSCAVVGGGPIGHLAALVLSRRGLEVTVVERDAARRSYYGKPDSPARAVPDMDGLGKFPLIVEATGSNEALHEVLHRSSPGAALLLLGFPYGDGPFNFESIVSTDKIVIGSVGSAAEDFRKAIDLMGKMDLDPFLETIYPLDEFHRAWTDSRGKSRLKILLRTDSLRGSDGNGA